MIYRQTRIGKNYQEFEILKFRTMDDEGNVTHPWLRRTGLDELPQIWNVIRGDMALFGPRPEVPAKDLHYFLELEDWWERYLVKPGIFGLAQVKGVVRAGDRFTLERKREQALLDVEQIQRSKKWYTRWWLNLAILAQLPKAVIKGQKGDSNESSTVAVRTVSQQSALHGLELDNRSLA